VSWGRSGVTLQFALALIARGFCTARRELSLARRRGRAPWLLGAGSEISSFAKKCGSTPDLPDLGAERPTLRVTERVPQREQGGREIAHDELGFKANDAIASAGELAISARIRRHAARVIAAVDLDHEARAGGIEVSDETEQRHLPPKRDA